MTKKVEPRNQKIEPKVTEIHPQEAGLGPNQETGHICLTWWQIC